MVFFKCIATLFDPVHRRGERTKWGLVLYTTIMFCATTVLTGLGFTIQSDSSIDNREFPGIGDTLPPGPLGYQSFTFADVLTLVSNPMFFLSGWLADGLLVTPCSFPRSLTWLTSVLLALPLLHHLLEEPLGHRLPLPHVPRILGYVPESLQTNYDSQS